MSPEGQGENVDCFITVVSLYASKITSVSAFLRVLQVQNEIYTKEKERLIFSDEDFQMTKDRMEGERETAQEAKSKMWQDEACLIMENTVRRGNALGNHLFKYC